MFVTFNFVLEMLFPGVKLNYFDASQQFVDQFYPLVFRLHQPSAVIPYQMVNLNRNEISLMHGIDQLNMNPLHLIKKKDLNLLTSFNNNLLV